MYDSSKMWTAVIATCWLVCIHTSLGVSGLVKLSPEYTKINEWLEMNAKDSDAERSLQAAEQNFIDSKGSMEPNIEAAWQQLLDIKTIDDPKNKCQLSGLEIVAKNARDSGLFPNQLVVKRIQVVLSHYFSRNAEDCVKIFRSEFQSKTSGLTKDIDWFIGIEQMFAGEYHTYFGLNPFVTSGDNENAFKSVRSGDYDKAARSLLKTLSDEQQEALRPRISEFTGRIEVDESFCIQLVESIFTKCDAYIRAAGDLIDLVASYAAFWRKPYLKSYNLNEGWKALEFCRNFVHRDKSKLVESMVRCELKG